MSQIALPLGGFGGDERVVIGPSLDRVIAQLAAPQAWPFGTAILAGPPRAGKSLLARWFAAAGHGAALDDADRLTETALFHRWNQAQAAGHPLLLVAGRPPGQWRVALPDLASRLGAALLLEIPPPDDALLAALLGEHARRRGLAIGEDAARWLLPRIERSHAEAEAIIALIDRLSLERKAGVTISLLRDALAARYGEAEPRLL